MRLIPLVALAVMLGSKVEAADGLYDFSLVGCFNELKNWDSVASSGQGNTPLTCGDTCKSAGKPLFALSGSACYCGEEIPPSTASSNSRSCQASCPYDPDHACGQSGVYVVYLIGGRTASTAPASEYASSSTQASDSSTSSGTAASSATSSSTDSVSSSSGSSSPSSSSATSSSSSSASSATSSSAAGISSTSSSSSSSSSKVTSSSVQSSSTKASASSTASSASSTSASSASSSASGAASAHTNSKSSGGNSLSGGAIAGIVVGVVVGVLAVAAAIAGFILWHRRKSSDDEYFSPQGSPARFKRNFCSFHDPYPPPPTRTQVDPRLNQAMLGDPRISIASLADARDYSRQVLTVANPDEKL